MSVIILSIFPASALTIPNLGEYGSENDGYYITFTDNNNCSRLVTSEYPINVVTHSSGVFILYTQHGSACFYDLTNDTTTTIGSNDVVTSIKSSEQISQCNYDIKFRGTENVFFQQPTLLSQLLSLVPGAGEKITGDLVILTTFGIGCLALLIGLSLLPFQSTPSVWKVTAKTYNKLKCGVIFFILYV